LAARIWLLGPVSALVPFLIWWVANTLAEVADPSFGLTAVAKPPWISSPVLLALGSGTAFGGMAVALFVLYAVAMARARCMSGRHWAWVGVYAVLATAALFLVVDIGIGCESPSYLWPSIDTRYAEGYSEEAFDRIRVAMSREEIEDLMCVPFSTYQERDGTLWIDYTQDGKCAWGDFAWILRRVHVKDGRVIAIRTGFMHD
jgi:hypothetical protein